jgi:methylthioribose-1-phosphate isomerase
MAADDREAEAIGAFGAAELPGSRFLTICNAGRLATTGIGTALAPVYTRAQAGEPVEVFACETRPLRQGARLTAWELADAGVPVTVLPDGAAGALLASGRVDAVIAGCDRVAANGDVANKIGTLGLAIAARHHGVPFYVLGPRSTLDVAPPSGSEIEIEQRAPAEIAVASGASVWNPAFDVTPAGLVTALITDAGVLREPYGPAIEDAVSGRAPRVS